MRASWKTAVLLALLGAGLALLTRIVIVPWVESVGGWVIPADAWTPLRAARSVANGDVFHLYEPLAGRTGYPYTPLLPILLAPVPLIGDRFHLLGDPIFPHPRPAMFLLLGPVEAFIGVFPIVYVAGRALAAPASRARVLQLQWLVFLAGAWAPVAWFHPEDTIVCALVIAACLRVSGERPLARTSNDVGQALEGQGPEPHELGDDDWRRIGVLLGCALLFKQWAIFPALPVLAAAPRRRMGIAAFYAFAIPAIVLVPFLLASPETWTSLSGTRATLTLGQPQIWLDTVFGSHHLADASLLHMLWGAFALVVAWRVRRGGRDIDTVLAATGVVMLARLAFEPVIFGYYLVPATVPALLFCARRDKPIVLRAITSALLCAFCMPKTFPQPVFFAILAFGLGYVCGPMIVALLPHRDQRRAERIPSSSATV